MIGICPPDFRKIPFHISIGSIGESHIFSRSPLSDGRIVQSAGLDVPVTITDFTVFMLTCQTSDIELCTADISCTKAVQDGRVGTSADQPPDKSISPRDPANAVTVSYNRHKLITRYTTDPGITCYCGRRPALADGRIDASTDQTTDIS